MYGKEFGRENLDDFIKRKVKGEGYAAASKNLLPSIIQNLV